MHKKMEHHGQAPAAVQAKWLHQSMKTKKARIKGVAVSMLNKYLWTIALLLAPVMVFAQAAATGPVLGLTAGRFFAALAAGLILALTFQVVLTALSVATGLNMAGPIGQKQQKGRPSEAEEQGAWSAARKISNAYGIWTMVTASLSLFLASLFAVQIGLVLSAGMGALLGLVIWGLFYLVTMVIEVRAVSSMVGSLASVVRNGFRSASDTITSMFAKSPAQQAVATASQITNSVREELFGSKRDLRSQLQNYIDQIKGSMPQPEEIARGIAQTLSDTEVKVATSPDWHQSFISFLQRGGRMNKENAHKVAGSLQDILKKGKQEAASGKDTTSKIADTAMRAAGMSGEEAEAYRAKVENYLRSTGKSQLNPEGIRHDIEELIKSPKAGFEAIKARVGSIDKSTVTALLAQRKDLSQDEAKHIVDRVDQVIQQIKGTVQGGVQQAQSKAQQAQSVPEGTMGKIQNYLDSLHRPELRYEGIRHDLELLFHDPKAGAEALIDRAKSIDRDSIKAILASRKDISDQDAEHIIERVESVRDDVVSRAEQMRDEVARRLAQAKAEALHQAEEARKTAATAAWWVVGTSVVSLAFAVLGGLIGAA